MNLTRVVMVAVAAASLGVAPGPARADARTPAVDHDGAGCILLKDTSGNAGTAGTDPRAGECGPARESTVTKTGCTDMVVARATWTTRLRPLVPERYGLWLLNPPGGVPGSNARIFIIDFYCDDVTVHGQHSIASTTTYVLSPITSIDGQPIAGGRHYLLYVGTNRPELFALYRSAGLPVDFLPTSSTTITWGSGTTTDVVYNIEGGEFAHTFSVVGLPPTPPHQFDPGATYLHDGRQGLLSLAVVNDQGPQAPGIVTGSVPSGTTLADLLATPLTFSNVRFPFGFRTGDHTVTLACAVE
jgi:hypothetical protein